MLMSERMEEITMEETRMSQRGAISISSIKVEIHHTSGKFTVGALERKCELWLFNAENLSEYLKAAQNNRILLK